MIGSTGLLQGGQKKSKKMFGRVVSIFYLYTISKQKNMKDLSFEFTVDNNGEIEDILIYSETMEVDCRVLMNRVLKGKKLGLGEKSEGMCEVEDDVVKLHYRVCTELGEDWDSDKWDDLKEEFPLTEI